jgi:radical SAM protein with 4Fe4S-binding SPASM domain
LRYDVKVLYLCDLLPLGRGASLSWDVLDKDGWRYLLLKLVREVLEHNFDVEIDVGLHPSAAIYALRKLGVNVLETLSKAPTRLSPEGRGFISIAPNGDVSISHFLPHVKIGNILEDDLKQLINHLLYKAVGDSSNLKGRCGRCEFKYVCGGSRVKAYVYEGDLLAEDPTCLLD